jgi:hypothetical protein
MHITTFASLQITAAAAELAWLDEVPSSADAALLLGGASIVQLSMSMASARGETVELTVYEPMTLASARRLPVLF